MQYQVVNNTRNDALTDAVETLLAGENKRLEPLLASFPQDEVMLRVIGDDEAPSQGIEMKLRLSNNSRSFTAHEASPRLQSALDTAFDHLRRQAIKPKDQLRRAHERKRTGNEA